MFKRILVPLDGSTLAEAALPLARELALRENADVYVVNVQERIPYVGWVNAPGQYYDLMDDARANANGYLNRSVATLRDAGVSAHAVLVDGGIADQRILDEAERLAVDLIVIATHGRSGLSRMLLGSVADRIVQHAKAPVLLVRPDASAYRETAVQMERLVG